MMGKIKLLIVDDSLFFRKSLERGLSKDPRIEIVGMAGDAFEAMDKIRLLKPDVVTMDVEMPKMNGIDFIKKLIPQNPLPVIVISALPINTFDALDAGAVDFVKKPEIKSPSDMQMFMNDLIGKIKIASTARVRRLRPASASPASMPALSSIAAGKTNTLIAIGASTGGTEAILEVVRQFPANMPGVVITQHMPAGFTAMYAERLNRLCKMEVREAKNGDRVQPGLALLAPGGLQMRVVRIGMGYAVQCVAGDKVNGHCPSVDVLFDSVANLVKDKAIGVILTGMGADGAAGLLRMRKNGAYTIGQDRESCVVYGMPMEAYKIGAVCMQSSLSAIPQAVFAKL